MSTTRYVYALCLGITGLTACSASSDHGEGIEGASEPIVNGTPASADYPEAGYLNIDVTATSMYVCSAALIAPKVVLTAGHCVDGHASWELHVGNEARTAQSAATFDWKENGSTTVNPNHHDVGLVFLDKPIQLAAWPTLATSPLPNGSKVTNVGRINNGTVTNSSYQAVTTVSDGASAGYPYDYISSDVIQPGDSGGPDFATGTHTIVAVNSGAGGGSEVLARVDLVMSWINQQVAAHGGWGTSADAGAPPPSDAGTSPPADAGAPPSDGGTSSPGDGGQGGGGTSPPADGGAPPPPSCPILPIHSRTQALPLSLGSLCASLPARGENWFTVTAPTGTTTTMTLIPSGDAVFAVGTILGNRTCAPTLTDLRTLSLSSTSAPKLCVRVTSPSGSAQSYTISRN